jgi:predicted hydrocarbon binding protein
MSNQLQVRPNLGDYSSIVCLKAIITGMEDALGEKATAIALTAAGRVRGKKLASSLQSITTSDSLDAFTQQIAMALGKDGTRLLVLDKIVQDGEMVRAYTRETVCSAGEPLGSDRKCTFSLGAVWGALEQFLGERLQGKQTESVLRGGSHDVFEFTKRA